MKKLREKLANYEKTERANDESDYRRVSHQAREQQKQPGSNNDPIQALLKPLLYRIEGVPQGASEASLVGSFTPDQRPRLTITSLCESVDAGTNELTATVVYRRHNFEDVPHLLDNRMTIDSHFFGFTPLFTPKGSIDADIIALTGLGGHAFGSWAVAPTEMWLRDFIPCDIPQVRILIYGYDSRIQKRNARSIMSDYTNNFILKLTDMRREGRYELRPVIFIGHSLGCLIIKEALIKLASLLDKSRQPLPVRSLIFFGAPHRGLEITAIKTLVDGTPSEEIVQELKKQSPTLTRLNDDFRHLHGDLEILTIFELEDTPSVRESPNGEWQQDGPLVTMVEKDSAILYWAKEQRVACNADHRHIARVRRGQSGCYSQVRSFIRHSLEQMAAIPPTQISHTYIPDGRTSKSLLGPQVLCSEFFLAIRNGATNAIRRFLNQGVSIGIRDDNARTALHLAAEWCSPEIVQLLLKAGAEINTVDCHGWTPLHTAARFNSAHSIELLSNAEGNLSARTEDECIPLHLAARYNPYPGVTKILLDLGSAIDSREINDWTPLHLAARYQTSFEVIQVLVTAGADLTAKNDEDYTTLHLASGHNSEAVLTLLLDSGADIEARDSDGWTPLKWAVRFGLISNVKKLISRSADVMAKSTADVRVSDIAFVDGVSESVRREIQQILQDAEKIACRESENNARIGEHYRGSRIG
jgi:ankyrin repeat protein/pimeloyl-ACP methyl ester carboxylesterase